MLSEGMAGLFCLGYRSVQEIWPGRCVESKCKRLEWSSLNFRIILRIVELIMDRKIASEELKWPLLKYIRKTAAPKEKCNKIIIYNRVIFIDFVCLFSFFVCLLNRSMMQWTLVS